MRIGGTEGGGLAGLFNVGGTDEVQGGGNSGRGIGGGGNDVPNVGNEGGSNFSVGGEFNAQNLSEIEQALDKALGDLKKSGDAIAQFLASIGDEDVLAKLLIEFAAMGRQQALDNRLQARDIAQAQLMGQAAETRQAATDAMIGAIVSAAISIVAAVVSIGGGLSQIKDATAAFKVAQKATDLSKAASNAQTFADGANDATKAGAQKIADGFTEMSQSATAKAQYMGTLADAKGQIMGGVSMLINALGQGFKGIMDGTAKLNEAQGMELAAAAQMEQSNADLAKKVMDELEEMIRATMQFIKEMKNAEAELMASMTRV